MDSPISTSAQIFRKRWLWKGCLVALFAVAINTHAESPSVWSRGITGMVGREGETYEFSLYAVNQDKLQLDGAWLYFNYAVDAQSGASVARFEATKDQIGVLWPKVRLEVRNEQTGNWKLIGNSSQHGKDFMVTVQPGSHVDLFVRLDAFKPFISKHKVGRIILTNGQESQFELKHLLPPEQERDRTGK